MSSTTRQESAQKVLELLTSGQLNDGGLVVDGDSTLAAYVSLAIIFTDRQRLLVRRSSTACVGALKWRRLELLNRMPMRWTNHNGPVEEPGGVLSTALNRLGHADKHQIKAGGLSLVVRQLRESSPSILESLHGALERNMVNSPPTYLLPGGNTRPLVPLELALRCQLLPYEDRRQLVEAAWQTGADAGSTEVRELLDEIRSLGSAVAESELQRALW